MKQLSVFLENREGRLSDVLRILAENNINILSLSLADTSEYGMLRLLVSEPEAGRKALREQDLSATLTEILAVKMPHEVGSLQRILTILCDAGINIEYMYALCTGTSEAALAIKTSDPEVALNVLERSGVDMFII
ncbi:MAG: ACT domain-containing protein [Lachnospiraceae bacterium]|nr:ACT domain-containing protein [Lachnospiraceae bacterium]